MCCNLHNETSSIVFISIKISSLLNTPCVYYKTVYVQVYVCMLCVHVCICVYVHVHACVYVCAFMSRHESFNILSLKSPWSFLNSFLFSKFNSLKHKIDRGTSNLALSMINCAVPVNY